MPKAAILLLADTETHGDLGRATNALTTVREFADNGDDVTLIFDGAGTRWAAKIAKEDHRLHPAYAAIRDKVAGACRFCAGAFEVREELEQSGITLLDDHLGHPSVRALVADGYEVITF